MTSRLCVAILAVALFGPMPARAGDSEPCACEGDCNLDGRVSIGEVITVINITLGNAPLDACGCLSDCAVVQGVVCPQIAVMPFKPLVHAHYGCPQ